MTNLYIGRRYKRHNSTRESWHTNAEARWKKKMRGCKGERISEER